MGELAPVLQQCLSGFAASQSARRLFHGRGHCYPGFEDLTVDQLGPTLLVACYSERHDRARKLAAALAEQLPGVSVCLQLREGRRVELEVIAGSVPEPLLVEEAGMLFRLQLAPHNLHTGLFLDAAPAREWVRRRAAGKRVLNLFAYTCAFSVAAVAGGAAHVTNVDMSRNALQRGRENHEANGHDQRLIQLLAHDVLRSWRKLARHGPYDMLIIDPPTNQRGSFNAERQYGQILRKIPDLAAANAIVVACLNSPFLNRDFLPNQMAKWCPACELSEQLEGSADFPDKFADRALKVATFAYRARGRGSARAKRRH